MRVQSAAALMFAGTLAPSGFMDAKPHTPCIHSPGDWPQCQPEPAIPDNYLQCLDVWTRALQYADPNCIAFCGCHHVANDPARMYRREGDLHTRSTQAGQAELRSSDAHSSSALGALAVAALVASALLA